MTAPLVTLDLWLDGGWQPAHGPGRIEIIDPANRELVGSVPACARSDVDRAVETASEAQRGWRRLSANDRADMLHEIATRTMAQTEDLVELLTREQGKPRPEQAEELELSANQFRFYAEMARASRGRVIPSGEPDTQLNFVVKEPLGVVAALVPWNYPILLAAWKLAPALAAGNTVVLKPSELTPLATLSWIASCFDHLPPGVVNVVTGYGHDCGAALVAHERTTVVAFTGSVPTGVDIARVAAPKMKRLNLELSGKDAVVVGADVDLAWAAKGVAWAGLINAGQVCTSAERIYVPRDRHAEFVDALANEVAGLRLGHGLDADVDMGPLISQPARTAVQGQIDQATARGARVVIGGQVPADAGPGWFLEPTVLSDVTPDMAVMRSETFGPVLPVMAYDSFDEALAWVNQASLALGATLLSRDAFLCKRFIDGVDAGTIWINDPLTDNYAGPFGGNRMSGLGRELGAEGLEAFQTTKHVHWDFSTESKPYWYPYGR